MHSTLARMYLKSIIWIFLLTYSVISIMLIEETIETIASVQFSIISKLSMYTEILVITLAFVWLNRYTKSLSVRPHIKLLIYISLLVAISSYYIHTKGLSFKRIPLYTFNIEEAFGIWALSFALPLFRLFNIKNYVSHNS